jgi:hypothetical protein
MPSYSKILWCMTKLRPGHECVYLLTPIVIIWNFKMVVWAWPLSLVILKSFEVGTWFLDAKHHLFCAKLFQNPSMCDKVTVWTQIKWGRTQTDRPQTDRQSGFFICLPWGRNNIDMQRKVKVHDYIKSEEIKSLYFQNFISLHDLFSSY